LSDKQALIESKARKRHKATLIRVNLISVALRQAFNFCRLPHAARLPHQCFSSITPSTAAEIFVLSSPAMSFLISSESEPRAAERVAFFTQSC
jgi:hypothetical protein